MYIGNRVSQRFIDGLKKNLETTTEYKKPENMSDVHYICCPCINCYNEKKARNIEKFREHLLVRAFMSGYTCWTEHSEYKEVVLEDTDVGGDVDIDQTNHCWAEQNMAREDTDMRDDDDVDQMSHCWTEQNMAGVDNDVGGDDDVDDLDEML
jgi:hypothetical protein